MQKHVHSVYVGIDVHRDSHKVALVPATFYLNATANWKDVACFDIGNNAADFNSLIVAIQKYASNPEDAAIAVDLTGSYSEPLVYYLLSRGYHPLHLLAKATRIVRHRLLGEPSKTDTIDASVLTYLLYLRDAHGLSFGISTTSPELGSKAAALRCLTLQRAQYDKLHILFTNRIHQFSHIVFPEASSRFSKTMLRILPRYPTPQDIVSSNGLKDIKFLGTKRDTILAMATTSVGVPSENYRRLILDLCEQRLDVQAKRSAILRQMEDNVQVHPYGPILLSFPGLGAVAAATIIGVVGDIDRWPDKRKMKKAFGIYGIITQSGGTPGKARMGNEGNRHARRALFMVVFNSTRKSIADSDIRDYYVRQVARGKPKMKAIFATMGKLVELIFHCLQNGEAYQYQGKYRRGAVTTGQQTSR